MAVGVQVALDGRLVPPRRDLVPCPVCERWARTPFPDEEETRACFDCRRTRWRELGKSEVPESHVYEW